MSAPTGGSRTPRGSGSPEEERPVIRDKRRIDPNTGERRAVDEPAGVPVAEASIAQGSGSEEPSADDVIGAGGSDQGSDRMVELEATLAERTADLQRIQAEFANYRRRMERDREVSAQVAVASALSGLLPVLDDIDRARAHGDLSGAFKAVADGLSAVLDKAGLVAFGQEGEPFDPSVHEAVTHETSSAVTGPTVTVVMRNGYRIGDRLLRPAMVGVSEPAPADMDSQPAQ